MTAFMKSGSELIPILTLDLLYFLSDEYHEVLHRILTLNNLSNIFVHLQVENIFYT